jgi:hypothetical protein
VSPTKMLCLRCSRHRTTAFSRRLMSSAPARTHHPFSDNRVTGRSSQLTLQTFGMPCSLPPKGQPHPLANRPALALSGGIKTSRYRRCWLTFVFQPVGCDERQRIASFVVPPRLNNPPLLTQRRPTTMRFVTSPHSRAARQAGVY